MQSLALLLRLKAIYKAIILDNEVYLQLMELRY